VTDGPRPATQVTESKSIVNENHVAFTVGEYLVTKGSLSSYRQGAERSAFTRHEIGCGSRLWS